MSKEYDKYLSDHILNVQIAYRWIKLNLPDLADATAEKNINNHDSSKYAVKEYDAYDEWFYGDSPFQNIDSFNKAWLKHIHRNEHHWQHWLLINDDNIKGPMPIDMPYYAILEMVCDWWSFSFKRGDLFGIFDWYEDNKGKQIMSENTRNTVEKILGEIKKKLYETKAIHRVKSII